MIRLRVSTLETFRRVCTTDYASEADLIDRIRMGQWADGPASEIMRAGTAWHAVLATPTPRVVRQAMCASKTAKGNVYPSMQLADAAAYLIRNGRQIEVEPFECSTCGRFHIGTYTGDEGELGRVAYEEFLFERKDVERAKRHTGPGLTEVTGAMHFDLYGHRGQMVELQGTCDHIRGLTIADHKLKFSTPDARDYEHSLQWRAYLLIHKAQKFTYHLWRASDPYKDGFVEIGDVSSFSFWRYPDMKMDLVCWIDRFLDWAEGHKLLRLLDTQSNHELNGVLA